MNHDLIPQHWSPELALAVFEFLNEICDAIWETYQVDLVAQLRSERQYDGSAPDNPTSDEPPFNDEIPF